MLKPGASIAPQPDRALQIPPLVDPLRLAADARPPVRVLLDGGAACVRCSPPIAGLGVRRLWLAVDPLPLTDG